MGQWFDGYDAETDVIFEEFNGQIPFRQFLRLLDKYPCQVQTKGGSKYWGARRIWITSPVHPSQWYASLEEKSEGSLAQLLRRLTDIRNLLIRHT